MASPQPDKHIRISTELWEAYCKIRIAGEARQMLDVIIRKTYGYNKKEDKISTSQFMELTGLSRRVIYKSRRKLKEMNLVTISKKGHSQTLSYSIQKDYDKWKVSPKKETVSKKVDRCLPKGSRSVSQKAAHNNIQYTKDILRRGSKQTEPQVKDFLQYFGKHYKDLFGYTYPCSFGKDGKIAKDLLGIYSLKALQEFIDVAFDWAKEGGWLKDKLDIGVFKQQLPKIIIKYRREYEQEV